MTDVKKQTGLLERKAEKIFKHYYKTKVAPTIGHHKMTMTKDLLKAGKKLVGPTFVGVFPQDKIPNLRNGESVIFNNHTHTEPGEHWLAGFKTDRGLVVFDSFARDLNKFIPIISKQVRVLSTDRKDREQRYFQENCGNLSLAWLLLAKNHGTDLAELI